MAGFRRALQRRAAGDHDVTRLELGQAQRLYEIAAAGADRRDGLRPLRPHPHRSLVADQRHQRMHRAGRLDIQGETRTPNLLRGRLDLVAAAVTLDLELRECGTLRRRKWNFEVPAL